MAQDDADLPRYGFRSVAAFGASVLRAAGARPRDAEIAMRVLVEANLQGVDSHGVARLPFYVRRMVKGLINPRPRPRVVRARGACALLDADNGLGVLVGTAAMERAIRLARRFGVGTVVVRNSNHYGAAGIHCELAAARGLIGLSSSNGEACLPPWGGRRPFFSNNPFALAAPTRTFPVVVDFATSVATRGNLMLARQTGAPIPEGWALDAEGRPTTDPAAAASGSLLPIAGPKGYALAMALEILCGLLGGGAYGPGVKSLFANWTDPTGTTHFFQAIDPEALLPRRVFLDRMDEMVAQIRAAPRAEGGEAIRAPGERRHRLRAERRRRGIPLHPRIAEELEGLAREVGARARLRPLPGG
jgi:LDH2 family malate/lactate/ureidoglycolate dehydrogenase